MSTTSKKVETEISPVSSSPVSSRTRTRNTALSTPAVVRQTQGQSVSSKEEQKLSFAESTSTKVTNMAGTSGISSCQSEKLKEVLSLGRELQLQGTELAVSGASTRSGER